MQVFPDGTAKVLDFGLGRAYEADGSGARPSGIRSGLGKDVVQISA